MKGYETSTYGDRIAEVYDSWFAERPDPAPSVDFLSELAGPGPALELGIGTGRVALPLAARGVEVHGIDASEAMVERLREKPGGNAIRVTVGDMADVAVEGRFRLVFCVFNTFWSLLTQDEQARCFENVAARLVDGGAFVLEAFVPDRSRFDGGQRVAAKVVEADEVRLEVSLHDPVTQRVSTQNVVVDERGVRLYPVAVRYVWPSELDLMARLAGLRLRERFGGWRGEPFTGASAIHVSVYEREP